LKGKNQYQLVFNFTPFYAESGGQVGDTGYIESENEKVEIIDTKLENNLILHITNKLPQNIDSKFKAVVDREKRISTANNHSATHLLHHALRKILGEHVEQKGSLVDSNHLRFDFSHFQKLSSDDIFRIESTINKMIRENIILEEHSTIPMDHALKMGALALFGEKYGDIVRVIKFGDSVELCGGTHVKATGQIGIFKIVTESSIAVGIRRIEAITGEKAEIFINIERSILNEIKERIKVPDPILGVLNLIAENENLNKKIEVLLKEKVKNLKSELKSKAEKKGEITLISDVLEIDDQQVVKDIAFQLKNEIDNLFLIIGTKLDEKVSISLMISDSLVNKYKLHAGNIIREAAKEISGGGGGQPFFATAGGKNASGLQNAIKKAISCIEEI
ncbi:MAG: DHHA1 domain-containing protein, partial [Bacteroidota bacterium]